jgi:hypothetical protein
VLTPGSFYRFIGKTTASGVFTAFIIKPQRSTREFEFVKKQQLIQQHQMQLMHAQQMATVHMKAGMFAMPPAHRHASAPPAGFPSFR